jgi:hypothetical protein
MIHAVVISTGSAQALAHTLADLVPGAVEGVIKRVTVAAPPEAEEALFEVSDDAGAAFLRLSGDYGERAAAACGRGDWLMVLEAGIALPQDWHVAAAGHMRRRPNESAVRRGAKTGWMSGPSLEYVLVPRRIYDQTGGFQPGDTGLKDLLRRLERLRKAVRL